MHIISTENSPSKNLQIKSSFQKVKQESKAAIWNLEVLCEACAEAGRLLGYDGDFANDPQPHERIVVVHELHHQVGDGRAHYLGADFGCHIHAQLRQQLANVGHGVVHQLCGNRTQLHDKFIRTHHRQEGQHLQNGNGSNLHTHTREVDSQC